MTPLLAQVDTACLRLVFSDLDGPGLNKKLAEQCSGNHQCLDSLLALFEFAAFHKAVETCGSTFPGDDRDTRQTMTLVGRDTLLVEKWNMASGWSVSYKWSATSKDTINSTSKYLVSGIKSLWAPTQRLGKFTDKDDAIAHAKKLWRSGAYYSVAVGTFCELSSESDLAIYVCQDVVYSAKRN